MPKLHRRSQTAVAGVNEKLTLVETPPGPVAPLTPEILFSLLLSLFWPPLRQMGVDEIYRGKKGRFLTVVRNLETAEPLWFGRDRKKETLDDFFRSWRDASICGSRSV